MKDFNKVKKGDKFTVTSNDDENCIHFFEIGEKVVLTSTEIWHKTLSFKSLNSGVIQSLLPSQVTPH